MNFSSLGAVTGVRDDERHEPKVRFVMFGTEEQRAAGGGELEPALRVHRGCTCTHATKAPPHLLAVEALE